MLVLAAVLAVIGSTRNAEAREADRSIDIAASRLPDALAELSRKTDVSIGAEGSLPQLPTPQVRSAHGVKEALDRLLRTSGYRARKVGPHAWRIERKKTPAARAEVPQQAADIAATLEILVTGTKREQALSALPMAATVVSFRRLQDGGRGQGSAYVAGSVEGLALTSTGSGRNRMFLRGAADSAFNGETQATVAVMLDDARLTLSAPDPDIRLVDVERVEVLKGPQGASHGTGALAGVYHIVTRRAQPGETSLAASIGGTKIADGDAGSNLSAVANLPVGRSGQAAIRLVAYRNREPGWIDNGTRENSNGTRVDGGRMAFGIDAGDWHLDATGLIQTTDGMDSSYVYRAGARRRPAQLREPHDNDLRHIAMRLGGRQGGVEVVLTSGLTWHKLTNRFDATRDASGLGLPDPRHLDEDRDFRLWDSEARISASEGPIKWLVGLSHFRVRQQDETLVLNDTTSLEVDEEDRWITELALFGNISLPVLANLRLDAGARVFRNSFREADDGLTQHRHRHGMTPSLALSWQIDSGQLAFVRYGSAIRQGDFDVAGPGASAMLKDDEFQTVEFGWRLERAAGRLEVGVWHSWWKDMQSDHPQGSGLFEAQNAGDARIMGIEGALQGKLVPGLVLQAGANWTSARLVRNTLGFPDGTRRLPAVPRYVLRASLEKELGEDARVRLKVRYIGPMQLSFDPQYDARAGNVLETAAEVETRIASLNFALSLRNLLDRRSNSFPFGNPIRLLSSRTYTPQEPRSLALSISYSFQ